MYAYTPTQLFTMHQQQQHLQQAMYAEQQQQQHANLLFHQYNQLQSIPAAYSNPALTSVTYTQQPIDQQQQQQLYRRDQLVPQSTPQIPTPAQHQQNQRSTPSNMMQTSSPNGWLTGSPVHQNQDVFRPIPHAVSRTMIDTVSYNNRPNSINSNPSALSLSASYESAEFPHHYQSIQQSTAGNYRRRERLYSGSSCYESDSSDLSSTDEDEFHWRLPNGKSFSTGRSELLPNEQVSHNNHGVVHTTNTSHRTSTKNNHSSSRPKLIQYIEENIIGKDYIFKGPWGLRRMVYCDYTASSRPLVFIENYIKNYVLPLYGNTHSEASFCAQQTTKFREEARSIIKKSVNANENDILIFTGTGVTGAVNTLVDKLDLHNEKSRKNTIIIIGAFEHHSNILPWQETGVDTIRIPTTQHGLLDKSVLKEKLEYYSKLKKRIICSLSAASNITGILTDVDSVSALVHSYSGLIFWDYATAAPYVKIDMNPSATAYKDAIFISTHKLLGGPSSPGILIAKKSILNLTPPKNCGGGTVNFVTRTGHEYINDIEIREEGGTPDIIGCIRAGLVFQLKDSIDLNYIKTRDEELVKRFHRRFKNNETLILLGSQTAARLPIFSFAIHIPGVRKYLHHHLVCRLFSDLFGIQVRSGCGCAGPYSLDLLNVSDAEADIYCKFLTEDVCFRGDDKIARTLLMKPGFTRLNLPYIVTDDEIEFIFDAIEFIATHGWKFLPFYTYNPTTGEWSHRSGFHSAKLSLQDITYKSNKMQHYGTKLDSSSPRGGKDLPDPFREAKLLAADALRYAFQTIDYTTDPPLNVPDKYKHMIWFALPIDIALMTLKQKETEEEMYYDFKSIPFKPDDAKGKIIHSLKTKKMTNGHEISSNRKKRNNKRSASTAHGH